MRPEVCASPSDRAWVESRRRLCRKSPRAAQVVGTRVSAYRVIRVFRIPAPEEPPCRRPSFHYKLGEPAPLDGRGGVCVAGSQLRETSMKTTASVSRDFALAALTCQACWPHRQIPIGRLPAHGGLRPGLAALSLQEKLRQGHLQSWAGRPVRAEALGRVRGGHENTGLNAGKSKRAREIVALLVARLQSRLTDCGCGSRLAG